MTRQHKNNQARFWYFFFGGFVILQGDSNIFLISSLVCRAFKKSF